MDFGLSEELVILQDMVRAFAGGVYQNPQSICPHHHMLLPRLIRSQAVKGLERPV